MRITLTAFKRKGVRSADSFFKNPRGVSEWDLLQEDSLLQSLKVNFVIVEYTNIGLLENGYADKVKGNPHFDVRLGDDYDSSVAYPRDAPILANQIASFVVNFAKQHMSSEDEYEEESVQSPEMYHREATEAQPDKPVESSGFSYWSIGMACVVVLTMAGVGAAFYYDWRKQQGSRIQRARYLGQVPDFDEHVDFAEERKKLKTASLIEEREDIL